MDGHIDDMYSFIENEVAPMYGSTVRSSVGASHQECVMATDSDNIIDQTLGDLTRIGGKLSLSYVSTLIIMCGYVEAKPASSFSKKEKMCIA